MGVTNTRSVAWATARKGNAAACYAREGIEGTGLRVRSGIRSWFGDLLKMPGRPGRQLDMCPCRVQAKGRNGVVRDG